MSSWYFFPIYHVIVEKESFARCQKTGYLKKSTVGRFYLNAFPVPSVKSYSLLIDSSGVSGSFYTSVHPLVTSYRQQKKLVINRQICKSTKFSLSTMSLSVKTTFLVWIHAKQAAQVMGEKNLLLDEKKEVKDRND